MTAKETTETPADRLREAAELVRQGHTRGKMIDSLGVRRCAVGAICRVQGGGELYRDIGKMLGLDPIADAAVNALHDVLPSVEQEPCLPPSPHKSTRVTVWNDRHAADGEHVAGMMEKAAAQYEERVR